MRNISNSEVTAFLRCKQQYVFAHVRNLEPIKMGEALERGNIGHEAHQRYIEARLDNADHDKAMRFASEVFTNALRPDNMEMTLHIKGIFDRYMGFHQGWPQWKLHEPEQRFDLRLTDDINMTIRYDAKMEEIATGRMLIVDWKFTYDFWTPDDHALNGQMPKYISVMNANGVKIHGGALEEIRTRKLSKENQSNPKMAWRRTPYFPSNAKKINMMRQHVAASLEIDKFRNLDPVEQEAATIPVLDKYGACKFCNFKEPCAQKLDGGDIEYTLQTAFKQNTYGYNDDLEDKLL